MGEMRATKTTMALNKYILNGEGDLKLIFNKLNFDDASEIKVSYANALNYIEEYCPFQYYVTNENSDKTGGKNQMLVAYFAKQNAANQNVVKGQEFDDDQVKRFMEVNKQLGSFANVCNQWLYDRVVGATVKWDQKHQDSANPSKFNDKYRVKRNQFQNSGRGLQQYLCTEFKMKGDISPVSISAFLWNSSDGVENKECIAVTLELWDTRADALEKNAFDVYGNTVTDNEINNVKNEKTQKIARLLYNKKINISATNEQVEAYIMNAMEKLWEHYLNFVDDNLLAEEIDAILHDGYNHHQIILNGAPGTGKTYSVEAYAKRWNINEKGEQYDEENCHYQIIQFHPSYDYTDFVEGIRPIQKKNEMTYEKLDGHFKAFCRKVVGNNLKKAGVNSIDDILTLVKKSKEGKASNAEQKKIRKFRSIEGEDEELYFFIIDEINRADISKVLGELMFGLEYRGVEHRFPTQYQNLKAYDPKEGKPWADTDTKDCFIDKFFIPENIIVLGTMNDIDKSVESFDFAMRRRFQWYEVKVNKDSLRNAFTGMLCGGSIPQYNRNKQEIEGLITCIDDMNKIISGNKYKFSEAYYIGPAYFKDYMLSKGKPREKADEGQLKHIFDKNIAPTLREYVRGQMNVKPEDFENDCRKELLKSFSKQEKKA